MNLIEIFRSIKRVYYIRKYGLSRAAKTALVTGGSEIAKDLCIGDYSYIGPRCHICPHVTIGKYVLLANDISIVGADHNFRNPELPTIFAGREDLKDTTIGDDVWIGARCIIMAGVTIGNGAIVGAGSVVTHDVLPYQIVAGTPAKFIRNRFTEEQISIHEKVLKKPVSYFASQTEKLSSSIKWKKKLTKK